jgi:hypothetical protein
MSDTPETDAFQQTEYCAYDSMWRRFAQKLERERDEARFDLAFRRELYAVQALQLAEARKTILELRHKTL